MTPFKLKRNAMKYLQLFIPLLIITASMTGCEKDEVPTPGLTSVNVVHAVVNASAIKVNPTGSNIIYSSYTDSIKFGAAKVYSLQAGTEAPVTIVSTADTTKPLFTATLPTGPGEMYSLFLAGQYPQADTVWVRDEISNYTDSLIGIRFINLSPNSNAIKINIKGKTQNEASDLGYKQITAFKQYAAKSANTNYQFEVRDAVTSTLLTSFTLTYTRFHNHTLVIKGLSDVTTGTNAISVFSVSPY